MRLAALQALLREGRELADAEDILLPRLDDPDARVRDLVERFDAVKSGIFTENCQIFCSPLYRGRSLQPNIHFLAFSSRSIRFTYLRTAPNSKHSQMFVELFRIFVRISGKDHCFSTNFIEHMIISLIFMIFSRDFAEHSRKC